MMQIDFYVIVLKDIITMLTKLYQALIKTESPGVVMIFQQMKRLYGVHYLKLMGITKFPSLKKTFINLKQQLRMTTMKETFLKHNALMIGFSRLTLMKCQSIQKNSFQSTVHLLKTIITKLIFVWSGLLHTKNLMMNQAKVILL